MSKPPIRPNFQRDVYNAGLLSSFTDGELNYIQSRQSGALLTGNPTEFLDKSRNSSGLISATRDNSGNVTGYRISSIIPDLSDEIPSDKTMNSIFKNTKKNSVTGNITANIKGTDGKTYNLDDADLQMLIRAKHGLYATDEQGKPTIKFFNTGDRTESFQQYVSDQIISRQILEITNKSTEDTNDLINRGIIAPASGIIQNKPYFPGEPIETGTPVGGDAGGTRGIAFIFVWKDPEKNRRNRSVVYDDGSSTKIADIIKRHCGDKEGNIDEVCKNRLGKEVDHLASGKLTRNTNDNRTRVDENGNVSGGPTSIIARSTISKALISNPGPIENTLVGEDIKTATKYASKWGSKLGQVSLLNGIAVETAQSLVGNGDGLYSRLSTSARHFFEGNHHNMLTNVLLWLKSLYKFLSGIDDGTALIGAAEPWGIALAIHGVAKVVGNVAVRLSIATTAAPVTAGTSVVLEAAWLITDLYAFGEDLRKAAIDKKKQEEREKNLRNDALRNGWDVEAYVKSNGQLIVPVYTFKIDPKTGKIQELDSPISGFRRTPKEQFDTYRIAPIDYEKDKDGNLLRDNNGELIPVYPTDIPKEAAPVETQKTIQYNPAVDPSQSPSIRRKFAPPGMFTPETQDNLKTKIPGMSILIPDLDQSGNPTGFYKGTPIHDSNTDMGYTLLIANQNARDKQQNYLDNLLSYRSSIVDRNPSAGPVLTSNGNPPTKPDDVQKQIRAELDFIRALDNYERWWVTMSGMGNSNEATNTIPDDYGNSESNIDRGGGGGAIMDSSTMPPELLSQTKNDGDYYITQAFQTFRIFEGNVVIINSPFMPRERYG